MIAIVEACGANLSSVTGSLQRLGQAFTVTNDATVLQAASHVILPGVGTAQHTMNRLQAAGLIHIISQLKQPVLGICVGMQVLFEFSEEDQAPCLSIIPGKIEALPHQTGLTLPHIGWNQLLIAPTMNAPLLQTIPNNSYVYYVHSYASKLPDYALAMTTYAHSFAAIIQYKNFYGMQFHPERSGKIGATLLKNFFTLS